MALRKIAESKDKVEHKAGEEKTALPDEHLEIINNPTIRAESALPTDPQTSPFLLHWELNPLGEFPSNRQRRAEASSSHPVKQRPAALSCFNSLWIYPLTVYQPAGPSAAPLRSGWHLNMLSHVNRSQLGDHWERKPDDGRPG